MIIRSSPKIIAFISASGGVGKTKLSLSLTYYLISKGYKTLFIDLDPTAGASLLLLSDDKYDSYIERGKTFSNLIKVAKSSYNFSDYKIITNLGNYTFDFILPGEDLILVINELWSKSASPGQKFRKNFEELIPLDRYSFVIIDSAPFFDPRYTQLSLYVADYFIIPMRPSIIDFKRTSRMLHIIRDDLEIAMAQKNVSRDEMWRRLIGIINLVPTNPRQAERVFVEAEVLGRKMMHLSTSTGARIINLKKQLHLLRDQMNILDMFVPITSAIERFPGEIGKEIKQMLSDKGPLSGFVKKVSDILIKK